MNYVRKRRFKSLLAMLLIAAMCVNGVSFSYASANSTYQTSSQDIDLTGDYVIIDGVVVTKAQFMQALSNMRRMPETEENISLFGYWGIIIKDAAHSGALAGLGIAIAGVFAKLLYQWNLADIHNWTDGRGYGAIFPSGTLHPDIQNPVRIGIMRDGVVINGVPIAFTWLSSAIVEYVANNFATIEYVEEDTTDDDDDASTMTPDEIMDTWNDWGTLTDHWEKHKKDFNDCEDELDYAKKANDHYKNRDQHQVKVDEYGDIRVYDDKTGLFGSYTPDGKTRTFYKPANGQSYFDSQPGN